MQAEPVDFTVKRLFPFVPARSPGAFCWIPPLDTKLWIPASWFAAAHQHYRLSLAISCVPRLRTRVLRTSCLFRPSWRTMGFGTNLVTNHAALTCLCVATMRATAHLSEARLQAWPIRSSENGFAFAALNGSSYGQVVQPERARQRMSPIFTPGAALAFCPHSCSISPASGRGSIDAVI